jgi:Tol biopolymer transport system component
MRNATARVLLLVALSCAASGLGAQAPSPAAPGAAQSRPPAVPPGTDIWLARLTPAGGLEAPANATARAGYDNQPSFTPDGTALLYTRQDGAQTDIWRYDLAARTHAPVTRTPESEYSPQVTPDGDGISVIRVEADATQRLWRFTRDGQSPSLVLTDVKPVGYHAWGPDGLLALFVLGTPNTLQVADSRTGRAQVVTQRIGRSLHRIPGRETASVLRTTDDGRWIEELDLRTRRLTRLVRALEGEEGDYAWTPDGAILMSDGTTLKRWKAGADWQQVAELASLGLAGASRLAVSPDGRTLAMVVPDR